MDPIFNSRGGTGGGLWCVSHRRHCYRATALDEESERIESAKAGAVAAVGSTVASLPFAATMTGSLVEAALALGVAFVTGLLFGVTYRYVDVRIGSNRDQFVSCDGRSISQADLLHLHLF